MACEALGKDIEIGDEKKEKEKDSLVHDDRHRIVQNTLTKNNGIQLWVDLISIENRKDRYGVGSGQRRSKDKTLEQCKLETFKTEK